MYNAGPGGAHLGVCKARAGQGPCPACRRLEREKKLKRSKMKPDGDKDLATGSGSLAEGRLT